MEDVDAAAPAGGRRNLVTLHVGPVGAGRTIPIRIEAEPEPIRANVRAGDEPVPLTALMPLARHLADQAADRAARRAADRGETVSCTKGCDACCRYLVPLSEPEARTLAGEVLAAPPAVRDALLDRFNRSARALLAAQRDLGQAAREDSAHAPDPGLWYTSLQLDCPLLHRSICSLYSRRPLSCRQHMVSSPPALCVGHRPDEGRLVPGELNVSRALSLLAAEARGDHEPEAILLPVAIAWACSDAAGPAPAMPAARAVERLAELLGAQAAAGLAEPTSARNPAA